MKTCLPFLEGSQKLLVVALLVSCSLFSFGQSSSKSMLINHGSNCGSTSGEQQFLTGATLANTKLVATGNAGMPFYNVLAAYDPEDQKVYYAKMDANNTYIYAVDYNFDGVLTFPSLSAPTYIYNYPINQLCFDNNGDNYTFSNFNSSSGKATLNRIDIATGIEIPGSNKQVVFPSGNVPNTLNDGDVVVLPNGRVFATFGNSPSKLYEINNSDGPGKGTATFLANLPRVCFAIAYTDGNLMIAGSDGGGCYYYTWDINSVALSQAYTYPFGKSSADMSSFTAGLGVSNRLLGSTILGSTSAILNYEIVLKNKGNIDMSNLLLTDNLLSTFGATATISNVVLSSVSNPAGLKLNTNFNGISDTNLLAIGQTFHNFPLLSDSVILRVQFKVSNLSLGKVYNNSILTSGTLGSGSDFLVVSDSSNNGDATRIDIDRNGVSDDWGENIPTPFVIGTLAIAPVDLKGEKTDNHIRLNWETMAATDIIAYDIERSVDGNQFQAIALVVAGSESHYSFNDDLSKLQQNQYYYRIKAQRKNQAIVYSNIIFITTGNAARTTLALLPNPFVGAAQIQASVPKRTTATITLLNLTGLPLFHTTTVLEAGTNTIALPTNINLLRGVYWLRLNTESEQKVIKIVKQ